MSDETKAESESWTKLDTTEQSWTNLDTTSLSVSAAAEMLGVSDKTLRRWDASGVLVPLRSPTGRRIYTRESIETFRKSQGLPELGNRQPQSPMVADDVDGAIDRITSSIDAGALTDEQRARIIQAASRLQQTGACNVAVEAKEPSKLRNGLLFDNEPGPEPISGRTKSTDPDCERYLERLNSVQVACEELVRIEKVWPEYGRLVASTANWLMELAPNPLMFIEIAWFRMSFATACERQEFRQGVIEMIAANPKWHKEFMAANPNMCPDLHDEIQLAQKRSLDIDCCE